MTEATPPATEAPNAAPAAATPPPAGATPPAATWRDTLPDEIKGHASLGKYADVPALAKAYVEAETLIGRKGAIIPKEGDAADVTAAWRKAIGVPDAADGYTIARPETVPEALWSDDTAKAYRGIAHEAGLTPAQAQTVAGKFLEMQAAEMARLGEAGQASVAALRTEWGQAYDTKTALAARAAKAYLPAPLLDLVLPTGMKLGDHPDMVRAFAKIGAASGEDVAPGLGHLEGETVAVLADGKPTTAVVILGQIVLGTAAARVHAGLRFTSLMETVDLEGGAQDGTSQSRARQIHRLAVRLYQTLGCIVGWRRGTQSARERLVFATDADPMDTSPALFTGDKQVTFPAMADRQAIIVVEQDQPLPCTVTAIVVTQNVGD
jgi:hypothetical protein